MNRLISFLNNRYFVAAIVGLFLLGFVKRIAGR